jgi:hypothetical protein
MYQYDFDALALQYGSSRRKTEGHYNAADSAPTSSSHGIITKASDIKPRDS